MKTKAFASITNQKVISEATWIAAVFLTGKEKKRHKRTKRCGVHRRWGGFWRRIGGLPLIRKQEPSWMEIFVGKAFGSAHNG
jgi:hypothetical protein